MGFFKKIGHAFSDTIHIVGDVVVPVHLDKNHKLKFNSKKKFKKDLKKLGKHSLEVGKDIVHFTAKHGDDIAEGGSIVSSILGVVSVVQPELAPVLMPLSLSIAGVSGIVKGATIPAKVTDKVIEHSQKMHKKIKKLKHKKIQKHIEKIPDEHKVVIPETDDFHNEHQGITIPKDYLNNDIEELMSYLDELQKVKNY